MGVHVEGRGEHAKVEVEVATQKEVEGVEAAERPADAPMECDSQVKDNGDVARETKADRRKSRSAPKLPPREVKVKKRKRAACQLVHIAFPPL